MRRITGLKLRNLCCIHAPTTVGYNNIANKRVEETNVIFKMANKRTPSCLSYNGSSATGSLSNKQPRPATRHPRHFPHSPDFATKPLLTRMTDSFHRRTRRNRILPVGVSAPASNFFVGTGPTRGKPPQRRPKAAKTQLDALSANP